MLGKRGAKADSKKQNFWEKSDEHEEEAESEDSNWDLDHSSESNYRAYRKAEDARKKKILDKAALYESSDSGQKAQEDLISSKGDSEVRRREKKANAKY